MWKQHGSIAVGFGHRTSLLHGAARLSVHERVRRDLERGDHWLARQRLASFLSTKGYDPDVLVQLGKISYEMHDAYEAGRMWLTSTACGEEAERAIGVFVARARSGPRQVALQLPRAARLADLDAYPPIVQERLTRLGLQGLVLNVDEHGKVLIPTIGWWGWVPSCVFLALALCFVGSCCVGAVRIFSWVTGGD